jgi:hypothetical protein
MREAKRSWLFLLGIPTTLGLLLTETLTHLTLGILITAEE